MKYLMLVLLSLFLQGCFYQSVNENDIRLGTEWCKTKGTELLFIDSYWIGSETAFCKNNLKVNLHSLQPEDLVEK